MRKFVLIAILVLAAVLRINALSTLAALNADEAAIGYNAYSLLKTGKDEHGNSWPVHFQSFNDYKPGLYFYIVMPFVALFGLSELAVRLPGALFGVGTVVLLYLLVLELFKKSPTTHHTSLATLTALFLAISPWHLHFSRGGWEVNVAAFFIILGLWAFLKGIKKNYWLYLSVLSFSAALYTYHAARIVVPLLGLGLLFYYRREILEKTRVLLGPAIVGLVVLVPLVVDFLGPAGASRAAGVGLFADEGPFWRTNEQRGEHGNFTGPLAVLIHNKPVNYSLAFFENYAEHFWGEFLFISGDDIQRNKVPEFGQLYLLDALFLLVGLFAIARKTSSWTPVLIWLAVAPIPAALTFQSPHALRAQNMVIPLVIISAYGALTTVEYLRKNINSRLILSTFYILLSTFILWNFSFYLHQYYTHMAKTYDFSTQWGLKELVGYVEENGHKFEKVVVTDRYDQPYIMFLFYLAYPPERFQEEHVLTPRDKFGFSTVRDFGKYTFVELSDWDAVRDRYQNALIAGTDEEIPEEANILETIYFPSGRIAFQIVGD